MSDQNTDDSELERCGKSVYWWEGEYEGNCELPKNHLEPFHYDGISYYDDDINDRGYEQANLEKLIAQEANKARLDEVQCLVNAVHRGDDPNIYVSERYAELKNLTAQKESKHDS